MLVARFRATPRARRRGQPAGEPLGAIARQEVEGYAAALRAAPEKTRVRTSKGARLLPDENCEVWASESEGNGVND